MYDLSIGDRTPKKIAESFSISKPTLRSELKFEGFNREITDIYYWILNFAYYTGKGFTTLKLEDYHFSSDNSQFGMQKRKMRGAAIQAFQQNLQQLVQLLKVHIFPLLKEVKQADFYYRWIVKIEKFDNLIREEKKKNNPNKEKLKKWKLERDEAISQLKDKWVTEVDGSKLWAITKSSTEQGLDYVLLPQLFFGTSLEDPLQKEKSLKEQLDETIYKVDITEMAKEQVARFLYRFYTWLPTAIRDTKVSFRMKIATLKQFYAQFQMYIEFMRPLLQEIAKKKDSFNKDYLHSGVELEDPIYANMFDSSYSFIRTLGVCGLAIRGDSKRKLTDLEFTRFGLYLDKKWGDIWSGPAKKKSGFIIGEKDGKYMFVESDKKDISRKEFNELKKNMIYISKNDLKLWSCIEIEFSQRRRIHIKNTPQGQIYNPYIQNTVVVYGKCWNIVEIAAYRERLKAKDFEILESFISELSIIKEDLIRYASLLEEELEDDLLNDSKSDDNLSRAGEDGNGKKVKDKDSNSSLDELKEMFSIFLEPFKGFKEIAKPLFKVFNSKKVSKDLSLIADWEKHPLRDKILQTKLKSLEDSWKVYTVAKKVHGFIQY